MPCPVQELADPAQLTELDPTQMSFWVASLFSGNPYQQQALLEVSNRGVGRSARKATMGWVGPALAVRVSWGDWVLWEGRVGEVEGIAVSC